MFELAKNSEDGVDESHWPIVVARWPENVDDAFLDRYTARMSGLYARGKRFGLLLDGRFVSGLTREQTERTADYVRETAPLTEQLLVAALVLGPVPAQREALTMINLRAPPAHPRRVFSRIEPALRWLRLQL